MADEMIGGGNRRPIQMQKVRVGGWTKARRRKFLATLAETCNVRMATQASGMRGKSPYDLRNRDPEFARLWQEALALGYERLEEALLRHALTSLNAIEIGENSAAIDADDVAGDGGTGTTTSVAVGSGLSPAMLSTSQVQMALAILNRYRSSVEGPARGRRRQPRATSEETDRALKRQLDILARKLGLVEAGSGGDGSAGGSSSGGGA